MDLHLDTSWCPVCDCAIDPRRVTVAANDDGEHGVVVKDADAYRASKLNGVHGLVHGTGRVKPGGGLRPLDTRAPARRDTTPPAPPSSPATRQAQRPKSRSVISQEQTPLYCSEACQLEDARRASVLPPSPVSSANLPRSRSDVSPPRYPRFHKSAPASASSAQSHTANSTLSEPITSNPPVRRIVGFTPLDEVRSRKSKPKLENFQYGTMMVSKKIEEALLQPKPQPPRSPTAVDVDPYESRVPPGWRHTDTEWRKIVYGDGFGVPAVRPQLPSRQYSMPEVPTSQRPARPSSSADTLGPFDRLPQAGQSVPTMNAYEQLYHKYDMSFARNRDRSGDHLSPMSRRLSVSTISSSVTHSSSGSESLVHTASPRQSSFSTVDFDSDSEELELEGEETLGYGFGARRREYPSLKRLSLPGSTASLTSMQRQDDALSRMLESNAKAERTRKLEARRIARIESDLHARKIGASTDDDGLDDRTRAVRALGPIMGRRTMSTDSASKKTHSWSYETLPPHVPLYPLPGHDQQARRVKKTLRNELTGALEELEVDASPKERKRLFTFGGADR